MENEYTTLQTIFDFVSNHPNPESYLCSAGEIILRQLNSWDVVQVHLQLLAQNDFIIVNQLDKIAVSITQRGIEKIKSDRLWYGSLFTYDSKIAGNEN